MRKNYLLLCIIALLVFAASPVLHATDYYMTLAGSGTQSGTSWTTAFAYANRSTVLNTTMQPGDTLYLEGNYYVTQTISITSSGSSTARKQLIGVDRGVTIGGVPYPHPVIEGSSTSENSGGAINLGTNASYWTLQNLEGRRAGWALRTLGGNAGLIVNNVTNYSGSSVSPYNTVNGLGFNDADNLQVINCYVARHSKYGIHCIQGCDNVLIQNCRADGTGTGDTFDSYPSVAGFMFHTDTATAPSNTNVTVVDCSSRNHRVTSANQGDGFLVEYNNTGMNFVRCISFDNLQSGFDDKGMNQVFTDCVSVRVGDGYKIWKNGTMHNCIATETTGNVVFLPQTYSGSEHILDAYNCTFNVSNTNPTNGCCLYIEHGPTGVVRATLYNCLLTRVNANSTYSLSFIGGGFSGSGSCVDLRTGTADETKEYNSVSNLNNPPKYTSMTQPWKPWDANFQLTADTAYDSITYGTSKGYNSALQTTVLDIDAEADTYVYNANPNSNYGTSTDLIVKDAPNGDLQDRISYLRFSISAMTAPTASATLSLIVTGTMAAGTANPYTVQVRQVTSGTWGETTTTYNNRPSESGTLINSLTITGTGEYNVDVTSFVNQQYTAGQKVSFSLVQPGSYKNGVYFGSRENTANKPVLEINQ